MYQKTVYVGSRQLSTNIYMTSIVTRLPDYGTHPRIFWKGKEREKSKESKKVTVELGITNVAGRNFDWVHAKKNTAQAMEV